MDERKGERILSADLEKYMKMLASVGEKEVMVYWFEDEEQNFLYGFEEEIEFHLFPGLTVKLMQN